MLSKAHLLSFFWIFIFFLVQNGLSFIFLNQTPSLLLIGVIFYAMTQGAIFGFVIGCFGGFCLDLLGPGRMGQEIFILGFLGFLTGLASSKIFRDSLVTQVLLPFLGFTLKAFYDLWVNVSLVAREPVSFETLERAWLCPAFLWTLIFSPLCFFWLKKVSASHPVRPAIWP